MSTTSQSEHSHNLLEMLAREYDRGFQDGVVNERHRVQYQQMKTNAEILYNSSPPARDKNEDV